MERDRYLRQITLESSVKSVLSVVKTGGRKKEELTTDYSDDHGRKKGNAHAKAQSFPERSSITAFAFS